MLKNHRVSDYSLQATVCKSSATNLCRGIIEIARGVLTVHIVRIKPDALNDETITLPLPLCRIFLVCRK